MVQRDNRFDFYKGLLMVGVVYGHVLTALQNGQYGTLGVHSFIRMYDMPMFAFIAGYFLKSSCSRHGFAYNVINKVGGFYYRRLFGRYYLM